MSEDFFSNCDYVRPPTCMHAHMPAIMRTVQHACPHPRKDACQPTSMPAFRHANMHSRTRVCGQAGKFFPMLTNSNASDGNRDLKLV